MKTNTIRGWGWGAITTTKNKLMNLFLKGWQEMGKHAFTMAVHKNTEYGNDEDRVYQQKRLRVLGIKKEEGSGVH